MGNRTNGSKFGQLQYRRLIIRYCRFPNFSKGSPTIGKMGRIYFLHIRNYSISIAIEPNR